MTATVNDIVSDTSVSGQLFKVIMDSIEKKPETGAEAIALFQYVYHKDIVPLLGKLKAWALTELIKEEAAVAQAAWSEMKVVEAKLAGCCLPSKK